MQEKILVTGGAGYIGTNIIKKLSVLGRQVVVVDNFSNSRQQYIDKLIARYPGQIELYRGDILDKKVLEKIFKENKISSVIHLAGKKYVPESFKKKEEYMLNNVDATGVLLQTMAKFDVKKLVFSSSITIYGAPEKTPTPETASPSPLSPYALTKMEGERMIEEWAKGERVAVVLRLSNPVGAESEIGLGDDGNKEYKNLLPYIVEQALTTRKLKINGCDHPTKDGSTVRDYIHVSDVAEAFVQALDQSESGVFNIGSGAPGYSVLEIIHETEREMGFALDVEIGEKRKGDIPLFVTDNSKAKKVLGLKIEHNLSDIVSSQLDFADRLSNQMSNE